jgi:hypothetical protein
MYVEFTESSVIVPFPNLRGQNYRDTKKQHAAPNPLNKNDQIIRLPT